MLAIGRLPGFRVDRTGACIIGASLMIAFGVLDFQQAFAAIDYNTIILRWMRTGRRTSATFSWSRNSRW